MAGRVAAACLLALAVSASAFEPEVQELEAALFADDQCEAGDESCALNALQLKADTELTGDITSSFMHKVNSSLDGLKPYIARLYSQVAKEQIQANWTMQWVAKAQGKPVVWDHGAKTVKHHRDTAFLKRLPPRTRYVTMKVDYLQQLMVTFWDQYTNVDRMRFGNTNVAQALVDGPPNSVGCADLNVKCAGFAKQGSCTSTSYKTYMDANCPCSCKEAAATTAAPEAVATTAAPEAAATTAAPEAAEEPAPALLEQAPEEEQSDAPLGASRNDWGATTKQREDKIKGLYGSLKSDIQDSQKKLKELSTKLYEANVVVKKWMDMKPGSEVTA